MKPHQPKIVSVEAIPLRIPFGKKFTMAAPHEATREGVDVVIVRIAAEDGSVGIGETQAWRRQGSGETHTSLVHAISDQFAPHIKGRFVGEIAPIMAELDAKLAGSLYAQAAIGDALYDLQARTLGLPLHALLGGQIRPKIQVGLAIGIAGSPDAMVAAAQRTYDAGYRHIRVKIGIDPAGDVKTIAAIRAHFGDRVVLRADANGGMNRTDALRLLARLEPYDLDIVEQPIAGWDLEGMAFLARSVRIPLSADESLTTAYSMAEIARRGAASVVQTKSAKNGGIHGIRKIWTVAEAHGIGIFPGNHPSTGINVAAVAHLAAAWPGKLLVGDFQTGAADMIADDILVKPVPVIDGHVVVPEGPGLGIALDEDKLAKYRVDRT